MKAPNATTTPDLLGDSHDLAGERPRKVARQVKWREAHGLKSFTVNIDAAVKDEFDAYLAKTGKSRNEVIAHLLRTQLLRKR